MLLPSLPPLTSRISLHIDTLATFTSYELAPFATYIRYAVIMGSLQLPRVDLQDKLMQSPDVLSVSKELGAAGDLLHALYECKYAEFFVALAALGDELAKDRYMHEHARFYCREMRIRAYNQILRSYRSVTMESMAAQFGVTAEFIDRELSRFVASGRVHCSIDAVSGTIYTTRSDSKNSLYQQTIKQGDLLLNRVQKLSRVINL